MNPDIKQRWVAALRSGDYEQGRATLKVDGKYCCLGVLCDLAEQEGIVRSKVESAGGRVRFSSFEGNGSRNYLPQAVYTWAGLENNANPDNPIIGDASKSSLAALNDDGITFEKIADVIEKYL